MSGEMTWTFEVVPQTNVQSLRATIRSTHPCRINVREHDPARGRQRGNISERSIDSILGEIVGDALPEAE
jgi:hypothetical protein